MRLYDTLLIPTDGSPCATRAVEYGLDIAETTGAAVDFLYVVDTDRGAESDWDIVIERFEEEGELALDDAYQRATDREVTVDRHLRRGAPSTVIVESAREYDADVILMGTCGRTGVSRILRPGSTAERVIRQSSIPVTVVPPNDECCD